MQDPELKTLSETIAREAGITGTLETRVRALLRAAGLPEAADLSTADAVLGLIALARPGWAVSIAGIASTAHGNWTCTLRNSRERDNDEVIGIGRGQHLPTTLLAALISVFSFDPRG